MFNLFCTIPIPALLPCLGMVGNVCFELLKKYFSLLFYKVSFGDFAPYMIANEASLAAVNEELRSPVTMERFRANVIVSGLAGFEEASFCHPWSKFSY